MYLHALFGPYWFYRIKMQEIQLTTSNWHTRQCQCLLLFLLFSHPTHPTHLLPLEYGLLWTQTFKLVWFLSLFSALVSRPFVVYKKTIWWLFMLARSKHVPDFRFPWIEINYHCKDQQGWLRRWRGRCVGSAFCCPSESTLLSQHCIAAPAKNDRPGDDGTLRSVYLLVFLLGVIDLSSASA